MPIHPQKCLIVGPSWVGDMIMAQSLFIQLKRDHPTLVIDVLAPAWSAPLLASMPEVHDSIVMPLGHGKLGLSERYQLGQSLRSQQYSWSICLPNSFKSALVPFWARIPRRTGYKGEMRYGLINDMHQLDKALLTMTVERFVALAYQPQPAKPPDCPSPHIQIEANFVADTFDKFALDNHQQPLVALCPGAEYGSAKRWPERYFATLGDMLTEQGYRFVILGSEKDQPVASNILRFSKSNGLIDLTGKTSLKEVIALLQGSSAAVSNDSGLMHIAAAVNTPLVALYGSSDPDFTPPLSDNNQIFSLGLDCSPCFKRHCPLGTLACLKGIMPNQVAEALTKLMDAGADNNQND